MSVIYEPSGRAREYAPLAVNLYGSCMHGCKYCYCPAILHKRPEDFFREAFPRDKILERLEADCAKMEGDPREILLCFTCDPYQYGAWSYNITREALRILANHHMKATILTKAGIVAERDFDILAFEGWRFGSTIAWVEDDRRRQWEPHAASIGERLIALRRAQSYGIKTWVSVEPVLDADQALQAIGMLMTHGCVDEFRIGKLNGRTAETRAIEKSIDWARFLVDVETILDGVPHIIKVDLEACRK